MNRTAHTTKRNGGKEEAFFAGSGEMTGLIAEKDWSATPLGSMSAWPDGLRYAVNICLGSAFPIAIYWGPDLTLIYNDAWSPIPGYKHPWALGKPAIDVWPEIWDDIGPLFQRVRQTGEASRSIDGLLPMQRHGYTEECYFDFTFTPIRDEQGNVQGIFNAVIETTYRVINERRSQMLRHLAECLALAKTREEVFAHCKQVMEPARKDLPFSLFYLNDPMESAARLSYGTGSAVPAPPVIPFNERSEGWPLESIRNDGQPARRANATLFGESEVASAWPEPCTESLILPVGLSKPIGFFVAGINPRRALDSDYESFLRSIASLLSTTIYNIESLEEEKKRSQGLAEIDRAKTVFFSNVSHEFRTPLTLMLAPVQELLNESGNEDQRRQLEMIYRNGLRLQKLVNNLLDFSRLEAGRMQAHFVATDIGRYTAELAGNFRSAIEKSGMKLLVNTGGTGEDVYVDRLMWEKIILNLLSNAFKFTFEGEIEVAVKKDRQDLVVTVRDTGVGIPAHELPHIFDRFRRVEGTRSRTFEGSGIGLSLVKDLVNLHGGTIDVMSEPGRGTIFTIRLKTGSAHLPTGHLSSSTSSFEGSQALAYLSEIEEWTGMASGFREGDFDTAYANSKQGPELPRIVLADDNADMRNYIKRLLAGRFDVLTAVNGKEALALTQTVKPDLLLTDVMMPEMDGISLVKALRADAQTAHTPVIVLSAKAAEAEKIEGLEAGADDYLTKPFSASELVSRVANLVASRQARKETETRLFNLLMEMPAVVALFRGPDHIVQLANQLFLDFAATGSEIIGKRLASVIPGSALLKIVGQAYQSRKPQYADEFRISRALPGQPAEKYFDFVCHPVVHGDRIEAILFHAVDVTEEVLAKAEARARETRLSNRAEQQRAVSVLGLKGMSGVSLGSLMREAVDKLKELLQVDFVKVLELMPGRGEMILRAGAGWNEDVIEGVSTVDTGSNSQAGYTLDCGEPVVVKDLRAETRFNGPPLLRQHDVVSGMSCVIWGRGEEPYGVIGVHSRQRRDFTNDEINFLQSVANILAAAVQRKEDEERVKKSNARLRESEERFRALAENIPNLCWMASADGWIYWYNSRWYAYTGTTPAEMEGWGWCSVHDPKLLPAVMEKWNYSLKTGETFEMVFPLRGADGVFRPFLTRVVPVRDDEGNILQWFGTNTDITERENLAKQKDEFIGIASHELKTPLTSISASIQIVERMFKSGLYEKAGKFLAKAEAQAEKLNTLINDLLDVSKIQAGRVQYNFSTVTVGEIIDDAVDQIAQQSAAHRIIVAGDRNLTVYGDKVRLEQVVTNLLTNAIKYSPGATEVRVDIGDEEGSLKVSVTDHGIGIPEEKQPFVFDRFFRVEESSNQFQGLGLGLYICDQIVRRHRGKMGLVSEVGKGSVFHFVIPPGDAGRLAADGDPDSGK